MNLGSRPLTLVPIAAKQQINSQLVIILNHSILSKSDDVLRIHGFHDPL